MAANNKIEKYQKQDRVLALSAQGKTSAEIAEIITRELNGADTISQPTVSRFLKTVRQDRAEQTRQIVHDHIKTTVPADLEALDEVEGWFLNIFRNQRRSLEAFKIAFFDALEVMELEIDHPGVLRRIKTAFEECLSAALETSNINLKVRAAAAMNAVRVIETKPRYAGILVNPDDPGSGGGFHPVDLEQFKQEVFELKDKL